MFLSGFGIRISLANEISLEVFLSLLFFWKSLMVEFTGEAVWSWTFLFFGCAGSWLLWGLFSSCSEWGLLCSCGAQASRCGGVSYCWAWALGHTGSVVAVWGLNKCGSQALEFRLDSCDTWALLLRGMWAPPSWSRDQTHVSCIGRQIFHQRATREALGNHLKSHI